MWERPVRGFWARLLFWREAAPEGRGGAWVPKRGPFARVDEHAELLAADHRERG